MSAKIRFIAALSVALVLLSAAGWWTVTHTTRGWFERDVALRAELAVSGARRAIVSGLKANDQKSLRSLLADITQDERILAGAICTPDLKSAAETPKFPEMFSCAGLASHLVGKDGAWAPFRTLAELPGGRIHVSAIPLLEDSVPQGLVVLIHDLSFADRRERSTQAFLLAAFVALAALASVVTLVTVRLSWTGWSQALRALAKGESGNRREFLPLLKDLRDLIDRSFTAA